MNISTIGKMRHNNNKQKTATSTSKKNLGSRGEREKTQNVNTIFGILRTLIPTEPKDRKLSKIETLRLASSYITHLSRHILHDSSPTDYFSNDGEELQDDCYMGNETTEILQNSHKICTFCLAESKKKGKYSSLIDWTPT